MKKKLCFALFLFLLFGWIGSVSAETQKISVLIVDGQNNHGWQETTPVIKDIFEKSERFSVDVATTPAQGEDMSGFQPEFDKYDLIFLNYTGDSWPQDTNDAFEKFVADGGGVVVYHAADNAFPDWKEFSLMTALGGWGGRNEKSGPYLYVEDGKIVRDNAPGVGGSHGPQVEFLVKTFTPDHPIMEGLPDAFLHCKDELYCYMRGPAENVTILATAISKKDEGGSGREEPLLLAIDYKKGRIFHTMLAHAGEQCKCAGFQTTLLRGAEWAATGKVTIPCPEDYPTTTQISVRE